jgi:hypothetical protein
MFSLEEQLGYGSFSVASMDSTSTASAEYSIDDRKELSNLTRKLRRAKRRMLLTAAQVPRSPVDQLREILLQVSVNDQFDRVRSGTFDEE